MGRVPRIFRGTVLPQSLSWQNRRTSVLIHQHAPYRNQMDRLQRLIIQYHQVMLGIHRHLIILSYEGQSMHLFQRLTFLDHVFHLWQKAQSFRVLYRIRLCIRR